MTIYPACTMQKSIILPESRMELSSGKKPPRSLSKQKSCGHLVHQGQGKHDIASRYNRGCLTPNPKTAVHRPLQRSESTTARNEMKRPLTYSSTENSKHKPRSGIKNTPRSGKGGVLGNTPRSTPAGTRSPIRTHKGKAKRDFERENIRPKKRLAIAYNEDADKDQQHKEVTNLDRNYHLTNGLIPIAEVKPLQAVRKLEIGDQYDVRDGSRTSGEFTDEVSCEEHKTAANQLHISIRERKKHTICDFDSGDFSVYVAVRVRPFSKRYLSFSSTWFLFI